MADYSIMFKDVYFPGSFKRIHYFKFCVIFIAGVFCSSKGEQRRNVYTV